MEMVKLDAIKALLKRVPGVPRVLRWRRLRYFRNEFALLRGRNPARTSHTSIILFTQHKSASVYIRDIVQKLSAGTGLIPINYERMVYSGDASREDQRRIYAAGDRSLYPERGFFFGPFRFFTEGIPDLERFRVILLLRDPRDVLVSYYFSMVYSHTVPQEEAATRETVLRERNRAMAEGIDHYVLQKSDDFLEIYQLYIRHLIGRPNVLFLKYEEMVADFESWLRRIIAFTELDVPERLVKRLIRKADFKVERENPRIHRRQVTPGDHRRKLRPETIEALNAKFGEVMAVLGWN